jgi:hypothetical protein
VNDDAEEDRWTLRISAAVTTVALAAVAAHLIWPKLRIDFVTVVLLAIASLPWLRGIVTSVELPGGASVRLAERRRKAVARDEQETDDAVRAVATADRAVPSAEKLARVYELADEYEGIRELEPPGPQRNRSMGKTARSILSLMPLENYDPDPDLLSYRAGRRLVAYLSLMADPDASYAEELTRTLTEREGIPYNQSWALRALNQIVKNNGADTVSSKSVARLRGMRDGLRPGSDRQLLLADLVDRLS